MKSSLNIALVSMSVLNGEHTHASVVRELARALARPGGDQQNHVTVYARRYDEATRERTRLGPGATLRLIEAGPARPLAEHDLLQHVRDVADELRRRWSGAGRPDVVHAHGWIGGLAACAVARELGIPFVQSYHGLGTVERRAGRAVHPARIRLEAALGRGADTVLAGSEQEAYALVRLGVPRPRIGVTPYGVDGDHFSQTGPMLPRSDRPRLVTVCRDLTDGGVATAIRTLVNVPGAELAIAGGPAREELENDTAVHRLRMLAKELHVADRVIFLGRMPRRSLPKLLRTARLVLCLSPDRPSPLVALEAMACGVPVVTTPVGGNADSVLDHITGLHVPAGRPVEIGRAVRRLLAEETTRHGYAIAAADRAHSRYSWSRIAAETLRMYARLLPPEEAEPRPAAAAATEAEETAEPAVPAQARESELAAALMS
ncbi:glycosyltransferase [Actinomadura sp. NPDC047616]|uniref:glycosyltransferase n=1 Tax=Actinomadura sp. NPDC047616 TaxID=3155914 RepID=UPI0033C65318